MPDIDFSEEPEVFSLDFGGEAEINATTLANGVIAFDELYRSAYDVLYPGEIVELIVVRTESGSFKVYFRKLKKETASLLKAPVQNIVLPVLVGVLVNWVTNDEIKIVTGHEHYVVEKGNQKIILPKQAEQGIEKVRSDPVFRKNTKKLFAICEADERVSSLGVSADRGSSRERVTFERGEFPRAREISDVPGLEMSRERTQYFSRQLLIIVAAVFERGKRKWQFLWGGHKISADIMDDDFFDRVESREYEFAKGDALLVDLEVTQVYSESIGAYENKKYTITKVYSVEKKAGQGEFRF